MTELFHIIEDVQAILRSRGVFKQVKVYRRGHHIYGAWSGGYVRLFSSGCTSHPDVMLEYIEPHAHIIRTPAELRYVGT